MVVNNDVCILASSPYLPGYVEELGWRHYSITCFFCHQYMQTTVKKQSYWLRGIRLADDEHLPPCYNTMTKMTMIRTEI